MTATASKTDRAPIKRTEHPHVVKSADVLSGERTIDGTPLAVRHILLLHRDEGRSPEAVAEMFGLSLAQVYDALSHAFDHPEEIEYYIRGKQDPERDARTEPCSLRGPRWNSG